MKRKDFIKNCAVLSLTSGSMTLQGLQNITEGLNPSTKMPMVFIGHGSPMNAIEVNAFTKSLGILGQRMERPQAIMVVSAHWLTRGTSVSINPKPHTIYDFGGFPEPLYQVKYTPDGQPELAHQVAQLGVNIPIHEDNAMGLDHGSWTVLKHIYPKADIPVFQLSIDMTRPPQFHYELGQLLQKMREKGVMIIGSGNIVHNLRLLNWQNPNAAYDWAIEFDTIVKEKLDNRDFQALVNYQQFGQAATLSIPTNDHYLPLLYTLGLADSKEPLEYIYEGLEMGSISMRCFKIG